MNPNPDHSYSRYGQLRSPARRLPGYDIENVRVAWASAPTATGNYDTVADIQAGQFWYFYKEHGTSIVRLHNIEFYDWALGGSLAETDKYVLNPFTGHSFMDDVRTAQDNKPVEQYYHGWDRTYSNRLQYDSRETRQIEVQYDGFIQETVWNGPWDLRGGWYCEREAIDTSIPQVNNLSRAIEPGVLRVGARVAGGPGNNFVALNGGRAFWKMDEGMFLMGMKAEHCDNDDPTLDVMEEENREADRALIRLYELIFGGLPFIGAHLAGEAAHIGHGTYRIHNLAALESRYRVLITVQLKETQLLIHHRYPKVLHEKTQPEWVEEAISVHGGLVIDKEHDMNSWGGAGKGPDRGYLDSVAEVMAGNLYSKSKGRMSAFSHVKKEIKEFDPAVAAGHWGMFPWHKEENVSGEATFIYDIRITKSVYRNGTLCRSDGIDDSYDLPFSDTFDGSGRFNDTFYHDKVNVVRRSGLKVERVCGMDDAGNATYCDNVRDEEGKFRDADAMDANSVDKLFE